MTVTKALCPGSADGKHQMLFGMCIDCDQTEHDEPTQEQLQAEVDRMYERRNREKPHVAGR